MTGSLAKRSPADVLSEVQRRQISGILTLKDSRVSRQIFVDAGVTILFAASSHKAESLTAWFRERGGLSDDQLRRATLEKPHEELLGTTLTRLGLITKQSLADLTDEHIRRVVREALSMRDGSWDFDEGALPFREQLDSGRAISEVILEWTRDIRDSDWIKARLGTLEGKVQRARRPPEGYQRVRLNSVEGYIMSRVDGTATMREICMVSPMGDDKTLCALLGLALAGILEMPAGAREMAAPGGGSTPANPDAPGRIESPASQMVKTGPMAVVSPIQPHPELYTVRPASQAPAARPASPAPQSAAPQGAPQGSAPQAPGQKSAPAQPPPPQAAAKPAAGARPGPMGLAPKPKGQMRPGMMRPGMAARPAGQRPAGAPKPAAAPAKPLRVVDRPSLSDAAEIEAEMLQRFDGIHVLDLYQVLGVMSSAPADDIRHAYYGLARRFHPDTFRRDDLKSKAEKVFGRITEAYATLGNQAARSRYDEEKQSRGGGAMGEKAADAADLARMNYLHGRVHFEHGRLQEALSFLQNACQQDSTKSEYFEYLGLTQAKNPRLKKQAEESLLKAIQLAPTSARAHAHLGHLYERAGAMDKARDMFRKALQWDPANEIALKGLEGEAGGRKGLLGLFSRK